MTHPTSDRLDTYVAHLQATNAPGLRIWIAEDEEAFYAATEEALSYALVQIERGARLRSQLDERELSLYLSQLLSAASVPTDAEGYHNGHVDLTITHPFRRQFMMLGECKIYRGFEHHRAGCEQLLVRYTSGRSSRTFCLDFFHKPEMYKRLEELRHEFNAQRPLKQIETARDHAIRGAFLTAHRHFTDAIVDVLHLGCNVYHPEAAPKRRKPRTKRAKTMKKY